MYLAHFRLKKNPFGMTPDPNLLFMTECHRDALAGITYSILSGKGFAVLIGDAGTGKTTVISRMLRYIPSDQAAFSVLVNSTLTAEEFLESVLVDFGIPDIPSSKVQRLVKLQEFVTEAHAQGKTCVLVVDEAHKLSSEVLEEIRMLTNFENAERKLLQILLAGQTELATMLNRSDLRQLKQRIAVRCTLQPLSRNEVHAYLRFRWAGAGAENPPPFDAGAIQGIASVSRGVPRIINAICDNALVLAFAAGKQIVTAAHVDQAVRELDLGHLDAAVMPMSSQPIELPKLNLPEPSAMAQPIRLRTLDRYLPSERKPPFLMRWLGKPKLANVRSANS
jgi:general secretion pathway protein A